MNIHTEPTSQRFRLLKHSLRVNHRAHGLLKHSKCFFYGDEVSNRLSELSSIVDIFISILDMSNTAVPPFLSADSDAHRRNVSISKNLPEARSDRISQKCIREQRGNYFFERYYDPEFLKK